MAFKGVEGDVLAMEALKATGVCRTYGRQQVLKDFDLTLESGSFEALMGPSGAGKSTFLHLAAGLLTANAGSILIGGRDVVQMSEREATIFRRRHIGVVFQQFNLLNERTVEENILLPVRLDHGRVDLERFGRIVERLGFADKLTRHPEELSGGEQQRVAIARAVMIAPDIILADEPTGNLDATAARGICTLMGELNESEKSTILIVTHDPVVAACATRVHFIKDGRIAASCPTESSPEVVSRHYLETYR